MDAEVDIDSGVDACMSASFAVSLMLLPELVMFVSMDAIGVDGVRFIAMLPLTNLGRYGFDVASVSVCVSVSSCFCSAGVLRFERWMLCDFS